MASRRPAALTLAVVFLVALGAEGIARTVESRVPPPIEWGNEHTDLKIEQIEQLEKDGGVDVVFLGSSIANVGFDPAQFIAESPWAESAYNASLIGSAPQLQAQWTIDVLLPALKPKVIVVGVTSRSLNDNARNPAIAFNTYIRSPGRTVYVGEANLVERITATIASNSALARIKPSLREPTVIAKAEDAVAAETTVTDLGHERRRAPEKYSFKDGYKKRIRTRALNDFEVGGLQLDSLTRLIAAAEEYGASVVLVDMPVFERDHMRLHPDGLADFDTYLETIAAFASEKPVELLQPPNTPWRRALFADTLHLNGSGTERLTRWLARMLAAPG